MSLGFRQQPIPWSRSLCPRCRRYPVDLALLGTKEEGHVCGECWKDDRRADEAEPNKRARG